MNPPHLLLPLLFKVLQILFFFLVVQFDLNRLFIAQNVFLGLLFLTVSFCPILTYSPPGLLCIWHYSSSAALITLLAKIVCPSMKLPLWCFTMWLKEVCSVSSPPVDSNRGASPSGWAEGNLGLSALAAASMTQP